MKLPETAASFVESVKADSKQLIDLGLWDIRTARLQSWLKQFCGQEEEFFAACLLDQLTFRTSSQFEAGLHALFRSNLYGLVFSGEADLELLRRLTGKAEPRIRLVPVIGESDPPTKSGPLVLRRLQRILQVQSNWMCWPWQASENVEQKGVMDIIFVDDFMGSGRQFAKFFRQWGFQSISKPVRFFYAPVVAHQKGIEHLTEEFPQVCVASAELLHDSHGFFAPDVWERLGGGTVTADQAKDWYANFAREKELIPKATGLLGVGELSLTFGFSHQTPNNSLPILWYEGACGWHPLLER